MEDFLHRVFLLKTKRDLPIPKAQQKNGPVE